MKRDLDDMVEAAMQRIVLAREIADKLKIDPRLHRLAMETVFVLEDTLVTLKGLEDQTAKASSAAV